MSPAVSPSPQGQSPSPSPSGQSPSPSGVVCEPNVVQLLGTPFGEFII